MLPQSEKLVYRMKTNADIDVGKENTYPLVTEVPTGTVTQNISVEV